MVIYNVVNLMIRNIITRNEVNACCYVVGRWYYVVCSEIRYFTSAELYTERVGDFLNDFKM